MNRSERYRQEKLERWRRWALKHEPIFDAEKNQDGLVLDKTGLPLILRNDRGQSSALYVVHDQSEIRNPQQSEQGEIPDQPVKGMLLEMMTAHFASQGMHLDSVERPGRSAAARYCSVKCSTMTATTGQCDSCEASGTSRSGFGLAASRARKEG